MKGGMHNTSTELHLSISTRKSSMTGLERTSRAMRVAVSRASCSSSCPSRAILALANVRDTPVAQKLHGVLYGLALRVKDARFECDVNFCFHVFSVLTA